MDNFRDLVKREAKEVGKELGDHLLIIEGQGNFFRQGDIERIISNFATRIVKLKGEKERCPRNLRKKEMQPS